MQNKKCYWSAFANHTYEICIFWNSLQKQYEWEKGKFESKIFLCCRGLCFLGLFNHILRKFSSKKHACRSFHKRRTPKVEEMISHLLSKLKICLGNELQLDCAIIFHATQSSQNNTIREILATLGCLIIFPNSLRLDKIIPFLD